MSEKQKEQKEQNQEFKAEASPEPEAAASPSAPASPPAPPVPTSSAQPAPPVSAATADADTGASVEELIWNEIGKIIDPEIGLSIRDLGLIYKVEPDEDKTTVIMTFTSMACPYGPQLRDQVYQAAKKIVSNKDAVVHVVFNPPWDPYTMASDEAKMFLGMV